MYDVIIVGQSLAGSLTALALHQRLPQLKICIVDQLPLRTPVKDERATALSNSSIELFQNLKLWDKLLSLGSTPIYHIHLGMDPQGPIPLTFKKNNETLGYNIQNRILRTLLHQELTAVTALSFYNDAPIKSIQANNSHINLLLENNVNLQARLIIGADGRSSGVRSLVCDVKTIDYQQTAITGTVYHSLPHHNQAFEFFIPQGPLAFIPLGDPHKSTLVWSLKNKFLPIQNLDTTLSTFMKNHLGHIQLFAMEQYPLKAFRASQQTGYRWVLVGDAANALHPVAGQGLNLAIRDIKNLCDHLCYYFSLGLDIGSSTCLFKYAQGRKIDQYSLIGATHATAQWMTLPNKTLANILNKGLEIVNGEPFFSNFLIKSAQKGLFSGSQSFS